MNQEPIVYAVKMEPNKPDKENFLVHQWSLLVGEERLDRIRRFRFWEDQWRSLAGDILVKYVLMNKYKLTEQQINISRTIDQKPVLLGHDIHFNVSHSGAWVIAAFHHSPVGIDIEKIGKADHVLAKEMFTTREYEQLQRVETMRQDEAFYHIWSAKESYLKAVGKGLSIPLHTFSVTKAFSVLQGQLAKDSKKNEQVEPRFIINDQVLINEHFDSRYKRWFLQTLFLDQEYATVLCTTIQAQAIHIEIVSTSLLIP